MESATVCDVHLRNLLGQGAFGVVLLGTLSDGEHVAVKMEKLPAGGLSNRSQLATEAKVYAAAAHLGIDHIPEFVFYGRTGKYSALVMETMGPSLERLFSLCHRRFGVVTVCRIACQLLSAIEALNSICYVHRDLKPDNVCCGMGDKGARLYLIDFGLASRYKAKSGAHRQYKENQKIVGTCRYMSVNTHMGTAYSRRDDLESIAYILCFLSVGKLPWQGIKLPRSKKYECVLRMKVSRTNVAEGCALEEELAAVLRHARGLKFHHRPKYRALVEMFETRAKSEEVAEPHAFEWMKGGFEQHVAEYVAKKHAGEAESSEETSDHDHAEEKTLTSKHDHEELLNTSIRIIHPKASINTGDEEQALVEDHHPLKFGRSGMQRSLQSMSMACGATSVAKRPEGYDGVGTQPTILRVPSPTGRAQASQSDSSRPGEWAQRLADVTAHKKEVRDKQENTETPAPGEWGRRLAEARRRRGERDNGPAPERESRAPAATGKTADEERAKNSNRHVAFALDAPQGKKSSKSKKTKSSRPSTDQPKDKAKTKDKGKVTINKNTDKANEETKEDKRAKASDKANDKAKEKAKDKARSKAKPSKSKKKSKETLTRKGHSKRALAAHRLLLATK